MAISTADKALLRDANHRIEALPLNAVPLVSVATARVNQSSFSYPVGSLIVDQTSDGWLDRVKVGMAFAIGTTEGGQDVTWGVVRKAPSGVNFYIDAKSNGDPGYARHLHTSLADNQYITVYKHRPPWGLLSAIRNGVFYKQWDVTYTDEGSDPPPLVNMGAWRQAFVDETGVAQLAFSATGIAWGSKTISSYQWYGDGGAVVSGGESSSSVTYEFAPGFYVVECEVTDSAGKTFTGYRYVWINERSGVFAPINRRYSVSTVRSRQDNKSNTLDITVDGLPESLLYPGQAWMLYEDARFGKANGGSDLSNTDDRVHTFIGYTSERSIRRTRTRKVDSLKLEGPVSYAKNVPHAPQQMSEVSSPDDWTEVTSDLSNPVGAAWYSIYHHAPQLLQLHDFVFDSDIEDLRKQNFVWQERNLAGQLNTVGELMLGNIGSRCDGSIVLALYGSFMSQSNRDTLDEKFDWQAGDVTGELNHPRRLSNAVGVAKAYSFAYDGGSEPRAYIGVAPGDAEAQGPGRVEKTFICEPSSATGAQTRTNDVAGHLFAFESAQTDEFGFTADRNIDIAEPCDIDVWHGVDINSQYVPPNAQRMIPTRVTRDWTLSSGEVRKTVRVEWRPETQGQSGVTRKIEQSGVTKYAPGGYNIRIPRLNIPQFSPLDSYWLHEGTQKMAAIGTGGLARTYGFDAVVPLYELLTWATLGATGTVRLWVPHGGAYQAGTPAGWVITTDEIGYLELATATYTVKHTFTTTSELVSADASFAQGNLNHMVAIQYLKGVGVRATYTTDNTTFTEVSVNANNPTDDALFQIHTGCHVSSKTAGKVITSRYTNNASINAGSAASEFAESLDHGATWNSLTDPEMESSITLAGDLHVPWHDNDDEDIVFYFRSAALSDSNTYRSVGTAKTNIAPIVSSNGYGPRLPRGQAETAMLNRDRLLIVGEQGVGADHAAFITDDASAGSPTWTLIAPVGTDYRYGYIAGDNPDTLWLMGLNGNLGESRDAGANFADKSGNLNTLGAATILAIAGFD